MKAQSTSNHIYLFAALALVCLTLPAIAATYQPIKDPKGAQTWASGINKAGDVVGYYQIPNTTTIEGFLLSGGVYKDIIFSGEPNTFATGINDSGLIVGYVQTQNIGTPYFGFTYQNGGFTGIIKFPNAKSSQALGVNNAGQIVGAYVDPQNKTHGFEYSAGTYTTIDVTGASSTVLNGINNGGDISGTYRNSSGLDTGFIRHNNGNVTVISRGSSAVVVGGINDSDQVAGYYTPPGSERSTGFEWSNGTFTTLLYPGAVSTQPFGINNNQVVVGAFLDTKGNFEGFMETP